MYIVEVCRDFMDDPQQTSLRQDSIFLMPPVEKNRGGRETPLASTMTRCGQPRDGARRVMERTSLKGSGWMA